MRKKLLFITLLLFTAVSTFSQNVVVTNDTYIAVNRPRFTRFKIDKSVLSTKDITVDHFYLTIYTNPVNETFNINTKKEVQRISVYDVR